MPSMQRVKRNREDEMSLRVSRLIGGGAILCLLGIGSVAWGQAAIQPPTVIRAPVAGRVAVTEEEKAVSDGSQADEAAATESAEESPGSEAAAKQAAEQKKAAHLQKLKQLAFDRRPAVILAEWLKVEQEKNATERGADESEQAAKTEDDSESTESAQEGSDSASSKSEPDPFDDQLVQLRRTVTLGNWPAVKVLLGQFTDEEGKAAFQQLLTSLGAAPKGVPPGLPPELESQFAALMQAQNSRIDPRARDQHLITLDDVLGIARSAPQELDDAALTSLGRLLAMALSDGNTLEPFVAKLRSELKEEPDKALLTRRQIALLLMAANEPVRAGEFLPAISEAQKEQDHQGLNLLSRYYLALHQKEKKTEHLNQAWLVTQAVFSLEKVNEKEREEALKRAVDLAPKVREELGQTWLDESFTAEPQRGMEIISAIGVAAATGLQKYPRDSAFRLKSIELQSTAVRSAAGCVPGASGSVARDARLAGDELAWRSADFSGLRRVDTARSVYATGHVREYLLCRLWPTQSQLVAAVGGDHVGGFAGEQADRGLAAAGPSQYAAEV